MAAFVHTVAMKAKPGRLAEARAEVASLAERAEAMGTSARLLVSATGDTQQAVLVLEFADGEAWAAFAQSDEVREARRARFEADYPIEITNTSLYYELDINPA